MCETERQAKMELIEFDRFAEQDDCDKYNMLQQSACEIRALENKNQQLKEVIDEVREWLKYKAETLDEFDIPKRKETGAFWFSTRGEIDNLLQILDKAKENK